jgi:hypothetical protein
MHQATLFLLQPAFELHQPSLPFMQLPLALQQLAFPFLTLRRLGVAEFLSWRGSGGDFLFASGELCGDLLFVFL